jgi:hypothetical protein
VLVGEMAAALRGCGVTVGDRVAGKYDFLCSNCSSWIFMLTSVYAH